MLSRLELSIRTLSAIAAACILAVAANGRAQAPAISVVLDGPTAPLAPGETGLYVIHLANPSSTMASNPVHLLVNLPSHVSVASGTITGRGSCSSTVCRSGGKPLVFKVASLAPGSLTRVQFAATVDNTSKHPPPAYGTELPVELQVTAGGTTTTLTDRTVVAGGRGLDLAITSSNGRVAPGGSTTFAIDASNPTHNAAIAVLRVPLPKGVTLLSAGEGGELQEGAVVWKLGDLRAGEAHRRTLTVKIDDKAGFGGFVVLEPELLDSKKQQLARARATTLLSSAAQTSLVIRPATSSALPDQPIEYEVEVSNLSPTTPTAPFAVTVDLPDHVSVSSGTITGRGSCGSTTCRAPRPIVWQLASIAPSTSALLRFTAVVDNSTKAPPPALGRILVAQATTWAFTGTRAGATVVVGDGARLDLAARAESFRVPGGGEVDVELAFGNMGADAPGTVLRARLPQGTSLVGASDGAKSGGDFVQWDLGTLRASSADRRKLRLKLGEKLEAGTLLEVAAELFDSASQRSVKRVGASVLVTAPAPLALSYTASPAQTGAGGQVTFKIELVNTSPSTPTGNFTVHATVPQHVSVASKTITARGSCSSTACRSTRPITWQLGSIAPGATVVLQFVGVVDNTAKTPAPRFGRVLSSSAVAYLHGLVRDDSLVLIGDERSIGKGGLAIAAVEVAAPQPKVAKPEPPKQSAPVTKPKPEKAVAEAKADKPKPQKPKASTPEVDAKNAPKLAIDAKVKIEGKVEVKK